MLNIKAYPNPTSGLLTLENLPEQAIVQILDVNGRIHLSKQVNNFAQSFDFKDLSKGIYIIKITSTRGNWTGKIVVN